MQRNLTFRTADSGSVAITFGLIISALMLFVGLAVDISRLNNVRSHLQASLDASSLAAAKLLDTQTATSADVHALAEAYFEANMKSGRMQGARTQNFKATADFATGTVKATVDVELPLFFVRAASSLKSMAFTPSSSSTYKTLRLEVAMVLDVTGSMNDPSADGTPKIQALKSVAKEFIDTLYSENPQPGFVRVGLLPYSASINIGPMAGLAGYGADHCVVDRPGSAAYTDAPPSWSAPLSRGSVAMNPFYSCPLAVLQPLQDLRDVNLRNTFKSNIDSMIASGGTAGHVGTAWGWYMLSPNWAPTWGSAYAARPYADNIQKVVIVLTDGMFNMAYNNGGGGLNPVEMVDPAVAGSAPYQALRICDNIKAAAPSSQAIKVYTIGFTAPPEAEALLAACSGAANFYSANNSSQLRASFKDIVAKLTSLRVSS